VQRCVGVDVYKDGSHCVDAGVMSTRRLLRLLAHRLRHQWQENTGVLAGLAVVAAVALALLV
jgi:hypothetical protein